jgi:rhamnulokinase
MLQESRSTVIYLGYQYLPIEQVISARKAGGSWPARGMAAPCAWKSCTDSPTARPRGRTLRWDVLRLWTEIQNGLTMAAKRFGDAIVSVGVDTWGVDFVLLTKNGEMLGSRTIIGTRGSTGCSRAFSTVPRAEIFAQTGLQFMEINTLYQLLALQRSHPELLAAADCLLMMPDFFHWCLCGSRVAEFTDATTSQCLNPIKRDWAFALLEKFGLPAPHFPQDRAAGHGIGAVAGVGLATNRPGPHQGGGAADA